MKPDARELATRTCPGRQANARRAGGIEVRIQGHVDRSPRPAPPVHGRGLLPGDPAARRPVGGGACRSTSFRRSTSRSWSSSGTTPASSADDMERRVMFITERGLSTTVSGISASSRSRSPASAVLRVYFEPGSRHRRRHRADHRGLALGLRGSCRPASQPPVLLRFNASNVQVAQLTALRTERPSRSSSTTASTSCACGCSPSPGWRRRRRTAASSGRSWSTSTRADAAAKGVSPQDVVNAVLVAKRDPARPASARIGKTDYDVLDQRQPGHEPRSSTRCRSRSSTARRC